MTRPIFRAAGLATVLLALSLTAGCATNSDLAAVRKLAQEAKDSADRANRTADEANAAAREARDAAVAARAASERTGEKVERAFKKAVQK